MRCLAAPGTPLATNARSRSTRFDRMVGGQRIRAAERRFSRRREPRELLGSESLAEGGADCAQKK